MALACGLPAAFVWNVEPKPKPAASQNGRNFRRANLRFTVYGLRITGVGVVGGPEGKSPST